MTEIILYRLAIASFVVWSITIEWIHNKQLKEQYQSGYIFAIKERLPDLLKKVDEYHQERIDMMKKLGVKDNESDDEARIGTERVSPHGDHADKKTNT